MNPESMNATTTVHREYKIEAVKLVKECGVGVSVAQAARDLDVHENILRK